MLRVALVLVLLPRLAAAYDFAKCIGSAQASPDATTFDAIGGETLAPPPVVTTFTHLDANARAKLAATVEASLPVAWRPHVEIDATGMAHRIVLELPGVLTAEKLAAPLLAFVQRRACLFGITAPQELTVHTVDRAVLFERAPQRIGGLDALVEADAKTTTITLGSHLWPVSAAQPAIDRARQLKRYVKKAARFDMEMFGARMKDGSYTAPGHMIRNRDTYDGDFELTSGPIIFCTPRGFTVRAAYHVGLGAEPIAPVLKELPAIVDRDGAVIRGTWIAPILVEPTENYTPIDRLGRGAADCLGVAAP